MRRKYGIWVVGVALVLTACRRGDPPGADVDVSASGLPVPVLGATRDAAASEAGRTSSTTTPAAIGASSSDASPTADASSADAPPSDTSPTDAALAADAAPLGQTRDKPSASSDAFEARMRAVWEAIVRDDSDRATASFFPLEAYEQVKAIATPARDWRYRLIAAFERDIHALHTELGRAADRATFVRVDLPEARARWVEPGEETNAVGYYRVYGTRIVYEVDGKERSFGVTSLISWRGEWYVVHLTGFQ